MRRKRMQTVFAVAAGVLGLSLAPNTFAAHLGRSSQAAGSTLVPSNVVEGLERGYRTTIIEQSGPSNAVVTADEAIQTAVRNFGWTGGGPATAHHVLFTDGSYGTVPSHGGPVVTGPFTLKFVDTSAWLVLLPNAGIPLLGSPRAINYSATLCVFVDAASGAYLEALAVQTPG